MVDKLLHESSLAPPIAAQLHCGQQLDHPTRPSARRSVFSNLGTEDFWTHDIVWKQSLAPPSRVE
eukprot:5481005-Prorocentrum_lima.AAC.1